MSDEQEKPQPKGGVRRVGKDNRKKKLQSKPLVFPPDSTPPETEQPINATGTPSEELSVEVEAAPPADEPQQQPADDTTPAEVVEESEPEDTVATPPIPEKPKALPPEHARFAPPEAKQEPLEPISDDAPQLPVEQEEADDEQDIPTTRIQVPKVVTPPAERFPPIAPPRDLPPNVNPSPTREVPPQPQPKTNRGASILANLLSVLIVLVVGGIVAYGVFILRNPYSAFNPFPPPTPFPVIITATFLPPTETTTPTFTPLAVSAIDDVTATIVPPTATLDSLFVTPTLPVVAPLAAEGFPTATTAPELSGGGALVTFTPSPGASPLPTESPFAFDKLGEVLYIPNGNGRGCEWSSIAGTAVDLNGEPINGLGVRFTDQISQEQNTVFTGSSATFGEGGFEFIISTAPVINGYTVQLLSPAGAQLSDTHTVVSSDQCSQNVAVINFEQRKPY